MQSSFWLKILFIVGFALSANPSKTQFVYKDIKLSNLIYCGTFDDPSDLDPLNDQNFQISPTDDISDPIITIFSFWDDNQSYSPNMRCSLDKEELIYSCKENEYRYFDIHLKTQWHAQGDAGKKSVHFLGTWKKNQLHLKPQRIFCYQNLNPIK